MHQIVSFVSNYFIVNVIVFQIVRVDLGEWGFDMGRRQVIAYGIQEVDIDNVLLLGHVEK